MKHYPSLRSPARLAGLHDQLSQHEAPSRLPTRAWCLIVAAMFVAGAALGWLGYAWAHLRDLLP